MMALTMLAHGSVDFDALPGPERMVLLTTLAKELRPYRLTITCAYNPHNNPNNPARATSFWNVRAPRDRQRRTKAVLREAPMRRVCLFVLKLIDEANKYKEQCNADT